MNLFPHAAFLAWKDYWSERLLSVCAVLGLAAALTPLLVLLGVQYGIIAALTEKLLQDPRTLEITPVGSGKYTPDWFAELHADPRVAFVLPQTRSIAATIELRNGDSRVNSPLVATAQGDPLLARYTVDAPGDNPPGIVLSAASAQRLGVVAGATISGYIERSRSGRRESQDFPLRVQAVMPPESQDTESAYVALPLLVALEDFRDGKAVPLFGWPGDAGELLLAAGLGGCGGHSPPVGFGDAPSEGDNRAYASFRLYAKDLDAVEPLRRFFLDKHLEVYVRSAEIDTVRSLDRAFTVIFALITGAALFGFAAATASSSLAGVKRKSRSLGILRLMGLSRGGMLLFPLLQALFTGLFGFALALGLYAIVALCINTLFAGAVPDNMPVCTLPWLYGLTVLAAVLVLSALSAAAAALQATRIEPSEVIRDI